MKIEFEGTEKQNVDLHEAMAAYMEKNSIDLHFISSEPLKDNSHDERQKNEN